MKRKDRPAPVPVIENWLVYVLVCGSGESEDLLAIDQRIQVFTTSDRAKAYRAARENLAGFRLRPTTLDSVKELAASCNMGVDLDPEQEAAELSALSTDTPVSGC